MSNSDTFFQSFLHALERAGAYNQQVEVAPAAILWTDKESQWQALLPRLREALPSLLTLGDYEPATRTGPAIWLRCMIARTLPEATWPESTIPIIYLPGVSRQELRAVEECPAALQPLAELQYRGKLWTHLNGRDWTIAAFLQNEAHGLGIEIAGDTATKDALQHALSKLAETPIASLRTEAPLTAPKINNIIHPEPVEKLLLWLNDPNSQRSLYDGAEWGAFRAICRERWKFDPDTDGELTGGERLGQRDGAWATVWQRFAHAPRRYPNLPNLLERAKPAKGISLFDEPSSWPQDNAQAEANLRAQLASLHGLTAGEARSRMHALEKEHGERRTWVWAELGQAPLANALPFLVALANATEMPCGGGTPTDIATAYADHGWRADAAVLQALDSVENGEDVTVVKGAIDAVYREWLRTTAETFQSTVRGHPLPAPPKSAGSGAAPAGRCLLFADGLRFDIAQRLSAELQERGLKADLKWMFSALPGVTPTAKPAVSPVASLLGPGSDFDTVVAGEGTKVNISVLRKELAAHSYPVLLGEEVGSDMQRTLGCAWTESGNLDSYGHEQGWKIARRIGEEVRSLVERVQTLLNAGWKEVRIITDHGWLLLPGGLPKAELQESLTEKRKGRCARLTDTAITDIQTVPWHWDKDVRIAVAPGICCFENGKEYEHGGLSPQECVIPVLTVTSGNAAAPLVAIENVTWTGLRCRFQVTGASSGLVADIRTKAADPTTSVVTETKPVEGQGKASLLVDNEELQGTPALIVVLSQDGKVISKALTEIGQ
jgi:hypothetical protein